MENKLFSLMIIILLIVITFGAWISFKADEKCLQMGGVVVRGYNINNCWKDTGFIEIN